MNSRKITGIAVVAFLVWQVVWPVPSLAEDTAGAELADEYARQEEIYRRQGRVPRGYVIDRTLEAYTNFLPDEFDRALANLSPEERWLDIGAGQGRAILDYYTPAYDKTHRAGRKRRGKKARSVALSIEDRRTPQWHKAAAALEADKVQYLHGKRLREYSREELGRFQLITDVMGGFSYTTDLSRFMQSVLHFLELNGSFLTVLQDVKLEQGTNKPYYDGYPFATEIENPGGSQATICSWLKSIACTEVRCESKEDWSPPLEVYHVRKVCEDTSVPALLPVNFAAGTPPQRGYQLGGAPKRPAAKPAKP
jgi:SAM-dependent methyltransferase